MFLNIFLPLFWGALPHRSFGELHFPYWNTEIMIWLQVIVKVIIFHFQIKVGHITCIWPITILKFLAIVIGLGWLYWPSPAPRVFFWYFHIAHGKEVAFFSLYYALESWGPISTDSHVFHIVKKTEKWDLRRYRSWEVRGETERQREHSLMLFKSLDPVSLVSSLFFFIL